MSDFWLPRDSVGLSANKRLKLKTSMSLPAGQYKLNDADEVGLPANEEKTVTKSSIETQRPEPLFTSKKGQCVRPKQSTSPPDQTTPGSNRKNSTLSVISSKTDLSEVQINAILNRDADDGQNDVSADDATWLENVVSRFKKLIGDNKALDIEAFKIALGVNNCLLAARFFSLFDEDGDGAIDLVELLTGLNKIVNGTQEEKLRFLFAVYDVDGNGTIERGELKAVLEACAMESSLRLDDEVLERLTTSLFNYVDSNQDGCISFDELTAALDKYPKQQSNLTISARQWMKCSEETTAKSTASRRYTSKTYFINNASWVAFLAVYLIVNLALIILSYFRYKSASWSLIVARACGMCLNFNCAFVVVFMLRNCMSFLRSSWAASYLPLDHTVYIHKVVGFFIAFFSLVHTVAHIINAANAFDVNLSNQTNTTTNGATNNNLASMNTTYWERLFTMKAGLGWLIPGFAYISGWCLDLVLLILVICSLPFVRRTGKFEVFYWTHFLFIPFWALLFFHGPIFWCFMVVPGLAYFIERLLRCTCVMNARHGNINIVEVTLLPSRVISLVIERPATLNFKPGDYSFINIPAIASGEWHPFSFSSPPETKGEFWMHIRTLGNWTNHVYDFFDSFVDQTDIESGNRLGHDNTEKTQAITVHNKPSRRMRCRVPVNIDGPFGTTTRSMFDTEHAVIIGAGIGITPFSSILRSIMSRYNASKVVCPNCEHWWLGDIPEEVMNLKKVDFIWVTRSQASMKWFPSLFAEIEDQQESLSETDKFLDFHIYLTSVQPMTDLKGFCLQMALEVNHDQTGRDVITGLRTKTRPGRPTWDQIFSKINAEKKGTVEVFFCGSPVLGKDVRTACEKINFEFHKEIF